MPAIADTVFRDPKELHDVATVVAGDQLKTVKAVLSALIGTDGGDLVDTLTVVLSR